MNTTEDKIVPRQLFGGIKRPKFVGGLEPTPEQLAGMAVVPETKYGDMHVFCSGCGLNDCFTAEGGKHFAEKGGFPVPTDWSAKYVQVETCGWCTPNNGYVNPTLKEVKLQ